MGILDSFLKAISGNPGKGVRRPQSIRSNNRSGRSVDYNQLFKNAVAQLPPEALTIPHIGITEPICPYCQQPLKKMPGGKTICKSCRSAIYVMKRPSDDKKALFTEAQRQIVNKLQGQKNRIATRKEYIRNFKRELNEYQDMELTQWQFLGCRDENADPIERELDGRVIDIGSEDEGRMLIYLIDPRYRFCPIAVIPIPK